MIQIDHIISCIDGLHARPAAELANIASEYAIEVYINKDGKIANIKKGYYIIEKVISLYATFSCKNFQKITAMPQKTLTVDVKLMYELKH